MEFLGEVKFIGEQELIGANQLPKVTIVLEETGDSKYPNTLAMEFFKDKVSLLDGVNVGDVIRVEYNTRANESKTQAGRFFNSISCWRLENITAKDEL